ncbi:MAG: NADH-quinone oxidoreductase subunit N [Planctomycetaceae bacterium]|nr:NADH-quinone oxidoreductase subunit N [Planctomycetaceae bacterium]
MPISSETIVNLLPEVTLVLLAVTILIGGTFSRSKLSWTVLTLFLFGVVAVMLSQQTSPVADPQVTTAGPLRFDGFAQYFRWTALGLGGLFTLLATQSRQLKLFPELLGALVLIITGLMIVSSAADLVMMFLGFELISIPTYVLLFIGKADRQSDEAAAKYFFLSILSSALMLYGFASLYGVTGEIEFQAIQASLQADPAPLLRSFLPISLVAIIAGLAFKVAAVPFHFYAPDVYQATTNLNAALLAIVPKIAGVVGLVRILIAVYPRDSLFPWQLVIVLAVLTMTFGNVAALWQNNLRRLLAYSSIAHAGYLLIGLAAALGGQVASTTTQHAIAAMVFYVVVYSAATMGAFSTLAYLSDDDCNFSQLGELAGLGRTHPVIGACLAVCMFSLSGIPPLAGFWGKLTLFKSALDVALSNDGAMKYWFITLSVLGAFNAAIAAAYYLRVIGVIYFNVADSDPKKPPLGNPGAGLVALLSVWIVIGIGLFTSGAMLRAETAAQAVSGAESGNFELPVATQSRQP